MVPYMLQFDWQNEIPTCLVSHLLAVSLSGDVIHPQLRPLGLGPRLTYIFLCGSLVTATEPWPP